MMNAKTSDISLQWRATYEKGRAAYKRGELRLAVQAFVRAIELNPHNAQVYHDLAVALFQQQRHSDALEAFQKAVALDNNMVQGWLNGANTLCALQRPSEAVAWYCRAIVLQPDLIDAHYNLANTYKTLGQYPMAMTHYQSVLKIDPTMAEALNNMGTLLLGNGVHDEALVCFQQAVKLKPDYVQAIYNGALTLNHLGRPSQAIVYVRRSLKLQPGYGEALALLVSLLQQMCDWSELTQAVQDLDALTQLQLAQGVRTAESPFLSFTLRSDAQHNLAVSQSWSRWLEQSNPINRPRFNHLSLHQSSKRIRIGYLSERFRNAATGHLTAGLFRRHDRSQFEIYAYTWGKNDGSFYRRRIENDVDHFVDIRELSNFEVADRIYNDHIDILLDMMGWMHGHRMGILAQRPAPIQISYLGYPGTSGAPFIDYLLADAIVIPDEHRCHYCEKVIWLPHCYQPNDPQTPIDARGQTRATFGLPEKGIVFCCFNTDYKIEPLAFKIWCQILLAVPDSVLWLLVRSSEARENLGRTAEGFGIERRRLVFASPLPKAQHLARLKLADLALDTFTVNGHTTTSDALWVGVPVITLMGEHFASRVASSILNGVGLKQLITRSTEDYQQLAVQIALDPGLRADIKNQLATNKQSYPLFDIDGFVRNLENIYQQLWRKRAGILNGQGPCNDY